MVREIAEPPPFLANGDWKTMLPFTSNRSYDKSASLAAGLTNEGAGFL